ncbi:MAG: SIP domain-containing protein [Schumannella sp.]
MIVPDILADSIAWHPADGDLVLLAGRGDDLPVSEMALATLPERARGQVFVEVGDASGIRTLDAPGRVCVTWLVRDAGARLECAVDAWLAEMLPVDVDREHRVYAWIAGAGTAHVLTNA